MKKNGTIYKNPIVYRLYYKIGMKNHYHQNNASSGYAFNYLVAHKLWPF